MECVGRCCVLLNKGLKEISWMMSVERSTENTHVRRIRIRTSGNNAKESDPRKGAVRKVSPNFLTSVGSSKTKP